MHTYEARTFDIPELDGISEEQVKVHLGLYQGYVKHVNLIREKIAQLKDADAEANQYTINELRRRFAFEFDGMRMHEYYFEQLEGGSQALDEKSALFEAASEKYGSWDACILHIKEVSGSRGIGWTVLYQDPRGGTMHCTWVSDHELGQLAGLPIIFALDMWEHAFMVDYVPLEKGSYVEKYLNNVNWSVSASRFDTAR